MYVCPCVPVCVCCRTRLITAVEGKLPPARLQEVLQAALNDHGSLLWQEHAERQQRVSSQLAGCGDAGETKCRTFLAPPSWLEPPTDHMLYSLPYCCRCPAFRFPLRL